MFLFQITDVFFTVYICQKSQQTCIFYGKHKFSVLVQIYFKISDAFVAILLDHLNQAVNNGIQFCILGPPGLKHIFDFDGISQFIIGQHISVSVIYISPGTGDIPGLLNLKDKIVQILLALNNLQTKAAINQYTCQTTEQDCKNG